MHNQLSNIVDKDRTLRQGSHHCTGFVSLEEEASL